MVVRFCYTRPAARVCRLVPHSSDDASSNAAAALTKNVLDSIGDQRLLTGARWIGAFGEGSAELNRLNKKRHQIETDQRFVLSGERTEFEGEWSERQDLNLRRLGPKPSALARLSYAPITEPALSHIPALVQRILWRSAKGEMGLTEAEVLRRPPCGAVGRGHASGRMGKMKAYPGFSSKPRGPGDSFHFW